jgi:hypothetical protein
MGARQLLRRRGVPERLSVRIKQIAAAGTAAALIVLGLAACQSGTSGQALENQQQKNDTATYEQNQPIPHFQTSQIRATLTEVEAIQALGSQTTSFFFNQGVADPIFSCPSLGMPVPSTAQLSDPDQVIGTGSNNAVTVGQMDPNGIYSPTDSTGTNVLCLNSSGQPYIQYWEGYVDAVSGAASWDSSTHQVHVIGQPTVPRCAIQTIKGKRQMVCTKQS